MNYWTMRNQNTAEVLKPFFEAGTLRKTYDGKIQIVNTFPVAGNWWRASDKTVGKHCFYLWSICFQKFGFIHSKCMNCYKVVAKLKTLEEVMQVKDIQTEMNVPSKVGIDDRSYTKSQYGAYWYNEGLEAGLEMLDTVREKLKHLGVDVFLKRGCTEFENRFGDSAGWHKTEPEKAFEREMDALFDLGDFYYVQAPFETNKVLCSWIEFAHSRGDMTYLKYTGGVPLYPEYRSYERDGVTPESFMKDTMNNIIELRKQRDEALNA